MSHLARMTYALILLFMVGCASSTSKTQTLYPHSAYISTSGSAFISKVDYNNVSRKMTVSFFGVAGGNETTTSAGQHTVSVVVVSGNQVRNAQDIQMILAAGSRYEISPDSIWNSKLHIKNVTADRDWVLDPKKEVIIAPDGKSIHRAVFTP